MKNFLLKLALRRRGRALMSRWTHLVEHFGNGDSGIAENFYPRLRSYRKRALRIALRLHKLNHQSA